MSVELHPDELLADLEQAVLGGVMVEAEGEQPAVPPRLRVEEFYLERHREVWRAILAHLERGERPTWIAVLDELERTGGLMAAGGRETLAALWQAGALAIPARVEQYAERVREACTGRMLRQLGAALTAEGLTREEVDARLALIPRPGLTQARSVPRLWGEVEAQWGRAVARLGLDALDRRLGGFYGGDLIVVGARPSHGKTSLLVGVALRQAAEGVDTLFISLETTGAAVVRRLVGARGRLHLLRLRSGALGASEYEIAGAVVEWLRTLPLEIRDTRDLGTARADRVLAAVSQTSARLILIDHLQEVQTGEDDVRAQALGRFVGGLKEISVRDGKVIMVAAQLLRAADRTQRPVLADIKESGGVEEKADIVLLLHYAAKRDQARSQTELDIIIAKNRDGATGVETVRFLPEYGAVESA